LAFPVNYNQGGIALVEKIASTAGFSFTENEIDTMRQRANFHGKYPDQVFAEEQPNEEMPAYLNTVNELYETLEGIRRQF